MPWSTCGRGRGLGPPSPRRHPSNGRTPGPSVGSQRWRWRSMVPWLVSFFKFFFFRYFPAIPEKRMTGQWFNMSICIKLCNIIYIVHTHFFFYSKNSEQMICWTNEFVGWSVGGPTSGFIGIITMCNESKRNALSQKLGMVSSSFLLLKPRLKFFPTKRVWKWLVSEPPSYRTFTRESDYSPVDFFTPISDKPVEMKWLA